MLESASVSEICNVYHQLYSLSICFLDIGLKFVWVLVIVDQISEVQVLCFDSFVVGEICGHLPWIARTQDFPELNSQCILVNVELNWM
jgi:hypothetical protein